MAQIPEWHVEGDWFDVCKCSIPCPCTFAQAPSFGDCDGILAYHVRRGHYGDVVLDGLNVLGVAHFDGNIWAGETKAALGMFIDERASEEQRDALRLIWGGEAGGFPAEFAKLIGEVRGIEYAPIELEVADDLAHWRAEIPGKVSARAEALSGPMTPPGKRVQTLNAPGSETGPGTVATWGTAVVDTVNSFGFEWDWAGRSSKHIPFDWSGPGAG
ncbi:MAG TPA: DUF1326 domain-containing protein [Gemmatimonadaceae bacterium]